MPCAQNKHWTCVAQVSVPCLLCTAWSFATIWGQPGRHRSRCGVRWRVPGTSSARRSSRAHQRGCVLSDADTERAVAPLLIGCTLLRLSCKLWLLLRSYSTKSSSLVTGVVCTQQPPPRNAPGHTADQGSYPNSTNFSLFLIYCLLLAWSPTPNDLPACCRARRRTWRACGTSRRPATWAAPARGRSCGSWRSH